jgi:hypothetical protein
VVHLLTFLPVTYVYDVHRQQVIEQLRLLPFAPSVQMQSVPGESLGEHLGFAPFKRDEPEEDKDDLDEKLGRAYLNSLLSQSLT